MVKRDSTSQGFPVLVLSDQQQQLYSNLLKMDNSSSRGEYSLGQMYLSAIRVLQDYENPQRVHQAAYSMRELMDQLEKSRGIERETSAAVTNKVEELEKNWDKAIQKSRYYKDLNGNGEFDGPLRALLYEINEFFSWYKNRLTGSKASLKLMRKLHRSEVYFPESLHKKNSVQWSKAHGFFNGVLHRNMQMEINGFQEKFQEIEEFLLDQLLPPKPTSDFDLIDSIIREGERDANQ